MKAKLYLLCLTAAAFLSVVAGCHSGRTLVSHWIAPKDTGVKADQMGPAEIPATADVSQAHVSAPIPAGTPVVVSKEGELSFTPLVPMTVTSNAQASHYTAPKAYAPPTPADVAQAAGLKYFYLAGLAFALAAGLAAWSGHYLAAVKFGFAAVALPVMAHFFSAHAAIAVGIAAGGIGLGLVLAWHTLNAKYNLEAKATAATAAAGPTLGKIETTVAADYHAAVADAEAALAKLKAKL
jgi:hypothetical protein